SCKGFFRRVYLSAKNLECYTGNYCKITKASRNACRACRYKKCVQVGMNPNEIRGRADNSSPNALPEVDDDIAPCSSSSNGQVYLRLNVENAVSLPSEFSVLDEAEQLVNLYMNLDRSVGFLAE
ncbi:zinc finger, C4 type, partial [Necator americanus]